MKPHETLEAAQEQIDDLNLRARLESLPAKRITLALDIQALTAQFPLKSESHDPWKHSRAMLFHIGEVKGKVRRIYIQARVNPGQQKDQMSPDYAGLEFFVEATGPQEIPLAQRLETVEGQSTFGIPFHSEYLPVMHPETIHDIVNAREPDTRMNEVAETLLVLYELYPSCLGSFTKY